MNSYCYSRSQTIRQTTREVMVGHVGIGGGNPIRVQSMTTTDTMDVEATVQQSIALAEVGCEIVRITAPNTKAAAALKDIKQKLLDAKIDVPLVADIHFTPNAAMEAVNHVEKVRVNPGNYADRKKFKIREYSDDQYEEELERLYTAFSPLVLRCKALGKAMRIGTNHGSLSDRIMNRYGDTPLGMVESALEFIRIAESHGYQEIILSMKASNPKVMIEAYRLAVAKMAEENMAYPLHLGVTEAGDGEDARIKSTIGIGSLLYDGLGDTIRVSLTEDPVYEIPVAQALAQRAMALWSGEDEREEPWHDSIDPYTYTRRPVIQQGFGGDASIGPKEPPRVIIASPHHPRQIRDILSGVAQVHSRLRDSKIEGLLLSVQSSEDAEALPVLMESLCSTLKAIVVETHPAIRDLAHDILKRRAEKELGVLWVVEPGPFNMSEWDKIRRQARETLATLVLDLDPERLTDDMLTWIRMHENEIMVSFNQSNASTHAVGSVRRGAEWLAFKEVRAPLWIRCRANTQIFPHTTPGDRLIEYSLLCGPLLCDGLGDVISVEDEPDMVKATALAYNILQGAKARISKTEFVACPSCGRTLFDLQSTTQKIRSRTDHLKGVTIAIMGCIVNGPGEMADADFGYVGGAPGKVNLYVGKTPVKYNVPEDEAVDQLIDLIAEHGKWTEPVGVVND